MAQLNKQFHLDSDDVLYTDGSVESEIYSRVCQKDETVFSDNDWTVFYHFSPLRQNILNWYPFVKESNLLEIGAGCGALTGMFTERVDSVTACELTLRRASIIYERYKEKDNLEIIVGNFLKIPFDKKFDYIVINGVLEYSKMIMETDSEQAFKLFLEYAKKLLAPKGKILLAIENRLGLKYLSGAPEDHTGGYFDGVDGYSKGEKVRTFSKDELINLCNSADIRINKWFYPFPDYKFATEIFTDTSVNKIYPSSQDMPYDLPRADLFDQKQLYHTLMKNEAADVFSNSFLVELCSDDIASDTDIGYVKISNNRNKEFCIFTAIDSNCTCAVKKHLYEEGKSHIKKMLHTESFHPLLKAVSCNWSNDCLEIPFVSGITMRQHLEELAESKKTDEILRFLELLRDGFYQNPPEKTVPSKEFVEIFGEADCGQKLHWVSGVDIDLIAENIFLTEEKWTYIDNEWVFDFEIPAEYVLWRTLSQLHENSKLKNIITLTGINEFLGINEQTTLVFAKWEQHFISKYVGIRDLSPIYKPTYKIDIHNVIENLKASQTITSHLFVFDKEDNVKVLESNAQLKDGVWQVSFEDESILTASHLRWDPLEGSSCKIFNVSSEGVSFKPYNSASESEPFVFETFDPQFILTGSYNAKKTLTINFSCELTDWTTGYFNRETEVLKKQELINELQLQMQNKENENQMLQEENASLHSNNLQMQKENEVLQNNNLKLKKENEILESDNCQLQSENKALESNNQQLQDENKSLGNYNQNLKGEIGNLRDYVQNHRFKAIIRIILKKFM